MDDETAHQQAGQQLALTPNRLGEQANKASMQFIQGLVDDGPHPLVHTRPNPWRIARAPGYGLVKFLEFFCREKTVEHVIEPMHTEFLVEYYAALQKRRQLKAAYVKFQMRYYLIKAVAWDRIVELLGIILSGRFKKKLDK